MKDNTILAVLLVSSTCSHCSAIMKILSKLVKVGDVASLEIVNVASLPERAVKYGVRSVPWLKLGPFELEGARTEGDIRHWLEKIKTGDGMPEYLADLLASGKLEKVTHAIIENPDLVLHLINLMADPETEMKVQFGIGAVLEELEDPIILNNVVAKLGELTQHASAKVRADAAHYLSFTTNLVAIPFLEALNNDENSDVREIATETLNVLLSNEKTNAKK